VHDHRRRDIFGDDQQGRPLFSMSESRRPTARRSEFVIRHEDERFVENHLHFLHIRNNVM